METRIKLSVKGLTSTQTQVGAYALILAEENGSRRIPIIVGASEAQSIAIAMERILTPRPLTHDLFISFMHAFGIELEEVVIVRFSDGIFYSVLCFNDGEKRIELDARTSDAIGIAMRLHCPIYTTEGVIQACGVAFVDDTTEANSAVEREQAAEQAAEPEDMQSEQSLQKWLSLLDKEDLNRRMERAIQNEDYEHAKMYRDELQRRNQLSS